jgi:hypothetical protein
MRAEEGELNVAVEWMSGGMWDVAMRRDGSGQRRDGSLLGLVTYSSGLEHQRGIPHGGTQVRIVSKLEVLSCTPAAPRLPQPGPIFGQGRWFGVAAGAFVVRETGWLPGEIRGEWL